MTRGLLCLALGSLVLAACGEPEESLPTNPDFAGRPIPTGTACDFTSVKNLVVSTFSPPVLQTAQGYVSEMETYGKWSAEAVSAGFAVMDLIGKASRNGSLPSPEVGSNLTKVLTKCMFDASKAEYTGLDALQIDKALSPSAGGAYYVVGAGYDVPSVPQSLKGEVSGFGRLSAVAPGPVTFTSTGPNPTFTLGNWTTALSVNTTNNQGGRALIYGYPVEYGPALTDPVVFEWAAIAPFTAFKDYGVVSICDGQDAADLMVHESSIGVLAYTEANLCGLPDASGTTKTGFRSLFTNTPVDAIHLEWLETPKSPFKVGSTVTFKVRATTTVAGYSEPQGVNNACLTITGSNNNGQPTSLVYVPGESKECPGQTDNTDAVVTALTDTDPTSLKAGYATFKFYVSKAGGLVVTLDSEGVPGRDIGDAIPLLLKYNVKP